MVVGADAGLVRGALVCDNVGLIGTKPNGAVAVDANYDRFSTSSAGRSSATSSALTGRLWSSAKRVRHRFRRRFEHANS